MTINQKCKGARDLLPKDTGRFRFIEDNFRSSCLTWGYQEVRTPTLEYLHLFTAAGTLTPSMLNKTYSFLDWDGWSGERVVLRPDGTIPVARLYIENLTQQEIARLFYVTTVFAFEETGKENREQWQFGAEFLGSADSTSDAEMILLAAEIICKLGIDNIKIQLSHAGMLKALLKELKLNPDEETRLLSQILDGNWQVLTETKSANSDINEMLSLLLDLKGKSSGFLENLKALPQISPGLKAELNNFTEVTSLLDALDFNYRIDITSTRGFEYYTGLCFKFLVNETKICSGGRYDNLVPLIGGKATPACGFALYIDPLLNLVPSDTGIRASQEILIKAKTKTPNLIKACFQLAELLRKAGFVAELGFNDYQSDRQRIITVQEKQPLFNVTDRIKNQNKETSSIDDVIDILGGSA